MIQNVQGLQARNFAIALVAAALGALLCLTLGAGTALAGPLSIEKFTGKVYDSVTKKGETFYLSYPNGAKKISNAKSSNTKVATVKVKSFKNGKKTQTTLQVTKKATGKTKITYKLGGKKKTATLIVKKYQNPFKTFTVGSKNLTKKFAKARQVTVQSELSGKITVKANSGWKIAKIYVYDKYEPGAAGKAVKSGYKLKGDETISYVAMKKGKLTEYMYVYSY